MKAINTVGHAGLNDISAVVNAKLDCLSFRDYEFVVKVLFLITDSPGFWNEFVCLTPNGTNAPPLNVVRNLVKKWTK